MNIEARSWIKKKVVSEIIGNCCDISNNCQHKHPIVLRDLNTRYPNMDKETNDRTIDSFNKIKFLLYNFGDFIDIDNLVDEHFSKKCNQNQWSTESHIRTFKLYVSDALVEVRDKKLCELI